MRVRVLLYVLDRGYPRVKEMDLPVNQSFRLRDSMWFQQSVPGDHRREIHMWTPKYEDWATVNCDEVSIWVSESSSTFILRLAHVRHCLGLGREIQFREDRRRQVRGLLPNKCPQARDIRVPRADKIGDDFVVVVYPAMLELPLVFIIRLEMDGLIAIWDYPELAQACFMSASPDDALQTGIRVWNPQSGRFDYHEANECLYAVEGYDFIIVRNEYNRYAPVLGKYIAELEMQTIQGVHPQNIPFDDPTHTPLARPAQSIRAKRQVKPSHDL